MAVKDLLSFPNPVDERAARTVATGVFLLGVAFVITRQPWLLAPLTYGFVARVLTGPKLSPLGQLATRVVAPRLPGPATLVPGPPKRFAQSVGLVFSSSATLAWLLGGHTLAVVIVALLVVAAGLEAFAGYCLGCAVFARLIKAGIVPETVCEACSDLGRRVTLPA